MELVGVAGSIGGLLGLAGQCVEVAITLRTFWQDIKAASNTAANFLNDLNSLIQTLTDIKKLLESVRDEPALRDCGLDAVTLRLHLEGCDGELRRWIATARKSRPENGKGVKHWFKSFIVAMNKESLRDIRREIQSRRQCLDLALGVLGRALDVHNLVSTKEVGNTLNTNQAQLLDVLHALQARHDQLDTKLDTISQSSFTSHPSLRSTASAPLSASRLAKDNGKNDRNTFDFASWRPPAESDNGSFSDQRSQASGASEHSAQAPRGRRTSLRGSPKPSTPFRRRSFSEDQPLHDLQESTDTTGDQTPDHDSHWLDESLEDGRPLLQRHYWDAAMLCQWTDGRDRINKWMLHSLGVDVRQAAVHQQAIEDELNSRGLSVHVVLTAGGSWERLAFQYWLIDEAAVGINMLQPTDVDAIPSLGPPSLRTDRSSQESFNILTCECCPGNPRGFHSDGELRIHEAEKPFTCDQCPSRFKTMNQNQRHVFSLHPPKYYWSCGTLTTASDAYHAWSEFSQTCGYCGEEFLNSLGLIPRIQHLEIVHRFDKCNQTKRFFRGDHFRQHLRHSHSGTTGSWTDVFAITCMKKAPPPETSIVALRSRRR
ncbi:hypothetical protein LTR95_015758 [Oleoguttula sp. CCFEE 5521]